MPARTPVAIGATAAGLLAVGVALAVVLSLNSTNDAPETLGSTSALATPVPTSDPTLQSTPDPTQDVDIVLAVTPLATPTGGVIIAVGPDPSPSPSISPSSILASSPDVLLPPFPPPSATPVASHTPPTVTEPRQSVPPLLLQPSPTALAEATSSVPDPSTLGEQPTGVIPLPTLHVVETTADGVLYTPSLPMPSVDVEPTSLVAEPTLSDPTPPVVAEHTPDVVEPTAAVAESSPHVMESTTVVAKPTPDVVESTTAVTEPTPDIAQPTTDVAEHTPDIVESTTAVAEPTLDVAEPTSDVAEPTSDVAEPTPDVVEPTAAVPEPTSDIAEPTSQVAEPTSDIAEPTSDIAEPTSQVAEPTSNVAEPTTEVVEPTAAVPEPTSQVAEPGPPIVTEPTPVVAEPTPPVLTAPVPPTPPAEGVESSADPADDETHLQTFDHVAHAVPGRAYEQPDLDGDGVEIVHLDASRSHSHYFDAGPPSALGAIESWVWFDPDTEDVLADSSTPFLPFSLGLTRVGLIVRDNFGNENVDFTNVTVTPSTREGVYCYHYDEVAEDGFSFTIDTNVVAGVKPVFGEEIPAVNYTRADDFPAQVNAGPFQTRCSFHIEGDSDVMFTVVHHGPMRLLTTIDGVVSVVTESFEWGSQTSTAKYTIPPGRGAFQLLYLRRADAPAELTLTTSAPVLHDLSQQLPLISRLEPPNSTLAAGGVLKVFGTGLWNAPNVYLDDVTILEPDPDRSTTEQLFVTTPSSESERIAKVTVGNRFGGSNGLPLVYADDALPPIKFEETRLKKDDLVFEIQFITNVKYGPDRRLYLASLDSFVYSLEVNRELEVSDVCKSPSLGNSRTVIGLAFNPAATGVTLYASSSIFFWKLQDLPGDFPWANGQVSILRPGHNGACLGIVGDPIITGLPVSNHDHGVNGMLFDDDGLLHLQVGGATNAGVTAESIGGIDESPLSAASLIADVNAPGFDGKVIYDDPDPGSARIISGDVQVFAPGWRNSFDLCMHSNGLMYATDNGANAEFGNRSTSCTEEGLISPYHSDDKLATLIEGRYGGHANRNRGRDDPVQCRWRSPEDPATDNYNPPIATLESSTDGIIEYTADLFGGQMKSNLILSKFSTNDPNNDGRVYRVQLDADGERAGEVDTLWDASGLSLEMSPWGDLFMARLYDAEVMVLRADYETLKEGTLIAVTPFRGPVGGGNEVLVTGCKFGPGTVALFGGVECLEVAAVDDDSFLCIVPPGLAGSVRVDIRLADGRVVESSGGFDYRYMRI